MNENVFTNSYSRNKLTRDGNSARTKSESISEPRWSATLSSCTQQARPAPRARCYGMHTPLWEFGSSGPGRWLSWCCVTFPQASLFLRVQFFASCTAYAHRAPAHARTCTHTVGKNTLTNVQGCIGRRRKWSDGEGGRE